MKDMRDLQKRIAKLERVGPGGKTPLVYVPMGSTPEEATAAWLAEHPGVQPAKINCFISSIPECLPLPVEFNP
jgi:hypothetical protein